MVICCVYFLFICFEYMMIIGEFVYKLGNKDVVVWLMIWCYLVILVEESRIYDYILINDYNVCVG